MPTVILKSFIPWILYFTLSGSQSISNETAALTGFVATLVFCYHFLRKKYLLEVATLLYFATLSILYLLPFTSWLKHIDFLLSNIALAAIMWISILLKVPFSMEYAKEEVEAIYWGTPSFRKINYSISLVWAFTLSLMALDSLLEVIGLIAANTTNDIIIASLFIFAITFTQRFPEWYQGYLFRKLSKDKEDISSNPYLTGNYAPIRDEVSLQDLPVEGKIPDELHGIYMRNGPNPAYAPISYTYPIDGDGMLHAIYIQDGKVNYRNRFVETKGLLAERKVGYALYGGVKKPIPTDPKLVGKHGDPGPIKNGAYIHIIRHAEQYLAMYEAGPAYEVSPQLQTIGEWTPKEATAPFNVNAHTRFDPRTGELVAFNYEFEAPHLRYYVLDKQGNLTANIPIEKPHSTMMHDFVLTENYAVFFDCPAVFDMSAFSTGKELLSWRPDLPTRIALVHRKTNKTIWIDTEAFFVYHFANSYEKNNQIIVDYVRHEKFAMGANISSKKTPALYRTIVDLKSQSVKHIQLNDKHVEFPRINDNFNSHENRYIYLPTMGDKNCEEFNTLMKYDCEKQEATLHNFGKHAQIGEAAFIPAPTDKQEDAGYLGLFVYDKAEDKSDFVLLSANDLSQQPKARVKLPRRVPHGLHGSWMDGQW